MAITTTSGTDLAKMLEQIVIKRDRLRQQLADAEREYDAVALTMKLAGHIVQTGAKLDFSNMTQLGALIAIAKANSGILVVKIARRMMAKAGMFKNPDNASSIIFTAIHRSNQFVKLQSGKYRLKTEEEKRQQPTPIPDPLGITDGGHDTESNLRFHLIPKQLLAKS
jgi:hypothetical protein